MNKEYEYRNGYLLRKTGNTPNMNDIVNSTDLLNIIKNKESIIIFDDEYKPLSLKETYDGIMSDIRPNKDLNLLGLYSTYFRVKSVEYGSILQFNLDLKLEDYRVIERYYKLKKLMNK